MYRFWDSVTRPILDALQVRIVVEIGVSGGRHTRLLLPYLQERGGILHAIDTNIPADISMLQQQFGPVLQFHQGNSIDILSTLSGYDAVLIDGDHNYYTVSNELQLIEKATKNDTHPIILLHDMAWPYARRDQYYDLSSIPPAFRQPVTTQGIDPLTDTLSAHGFNEGMTHAQQSGGPRNGVKTAVEDFLSAHDDWMLRIVHGLHGLGILVHRTSATALQGLLLPDTPLADAHIQVLEEERLKALTMAHALQQCNHPDMPQQIQRMERTISWRITAPLRLLGRMLSGKRRS